MKIFYLLTLLLATTTANGGEIYSWKDENGRQHYSDKKPLNAESKIQETEILERSRTSIVSKLSDPNLSASTLMSNLAQDIPNYKGYAIELIIEPNGVVSQTKVLTKNVIGTKLETELKRAFSSVNFGSENVRVTKFTFNMNYRSFN
ncbi:DUF4124 domain-containing protein [Aurantivibrio infirmus]